MRQILIGFFLGHILRVWDPKEYGYIIFDTCRVGLHREYMLEYYFIGNIRIRSDFKLFLVDEGRYLDQLWGLYVVC